MRKFGFKQLYLILCVGSLFIGLCTSVWSQTTPTIKIGQSDLAPGGYLDFRYSYSEEAKNTPNVPESIDFVRAVLFLDGRITADVMGRIQYDMRSSTLLDAYVKLTHLPYTDWEIIVGQFKMPFSVAGEVLATPFQETIRGPLIYEGGITTFSDRETGVMARGDMLDKKGQYILGVFNGNGINTGDDNDSKDRMIQFKVFPWRDDTRSPLKPMEFGAAWIVGQVSEINAIGVDEREKYAFSVKYAIDKLLITYEYFLQTFNVDGPNNINTKSWYLQLSSDEEMNLFNKKQIVRPIARYEFYDPDSTNSQDEVRVVTMGFSWQINNALRLQLNFNDYKAHIKTIEKESLVQLEVKF
jgi:hypothetical protein